MPVLGEQRLSETVNGPTLTHIYDEWGRHISRTTPTGATAGWRYDKAGRPAQMLAAGRGIDFAHDVAGREASRRIGGVLTWTNAFDSAGRLTTRTVVAGARRQAIRQRTCVYRAVRQRRRDRRSRHRSTPHHPGCIRPRHRCAGSQLERNGCRPRGTHTRRDPPVQPPRTCRRWRLGCMVWPSGPGSQRPQSI
ncbi:hypothetical protein [Streptomyces sp. NPDC090798]|uniref:hypothetical protein n=1 Tax=Streptomyces sp. NPDC090798 TaxID=3365968 RepID=UPI0038307D48